MPWRTALLCLALGAFLKFPEAVLSPGSDTGMFATYGRLLLQGARPYVDFWDLHPPLVFGYWAVVEAIAGTDWLRSCVFSCTGLTAHTLDLLLSVVAALVCGAIVRRAGGSPLTAALASLLVVGFSDQAMLSQEGSNPSKLTLLPSCFAVWLYLSGLGEKTDWRRALASGAAAGVAVLAKQPALLTLVALTAHAALRRDRRGVTGSLLGAACVLALACALLAVLGALDGFIAQVWVYNVQRVLVGYFVSPAKAPTIGLDRVLAESSGVLAVAGVVGMVVVARAPLNARQAALAYWAALNIVAVTAFREFVYVVPSLAVVAAMGFERIWHAQERRRRAGRRALLLGLGLVAVLLTTGFQRSQFARARFERGEGATLTRSEELGWMLRRDLPPGPLFIYGNGAEMYLLGDRFPATRHLNAEALRISAPGATQTRAEVASTLATRPPPVVVLAPHHDEAELNLADYPALRALLDHCYTQHTLTSDADPSWIVLVRSGACGPS